MDISSYLPFAFICVTSFFTLTNPLGTMPVFLAITRGFTEEQRVHVLKRAILISFVTLLAFTLCGQFLFTFFGISANGFRIAAGFIIFKIGWDMLNARYTHTKLKEEEVKDYADDISITPLSIPILCGPGAIANSIMLMDEASSDAIKCIILFGSMLAIYIVSFVILRASTRLNKWMGETGNNVMMRLMGLILMVLAVEFFINGIRPVLTDIISAAVK